MIQKENLQFELEDLIEDIFEKNRIQLNKSQTKRISLLLLLLFQFD